MTASPPKAPKATKTALIAFIRSRLAEDSRWAVQGMLRILAFQTLDERHAHETRESNGVGFSSVDAQFLTSCAEAYTANGSLSPRCLAAVRKNMPKYAGQLYRISDRVVLERAWRKSLQIPQQAQLPL